MHWNNNVTDILEKQKANKKSYNNENSKYKGGYTRIYQYDNSKNNSKPYYNAQQEIPDDPYQQYSNHKTPNYNQPKNPYDNNRNSTHKTSVYHKEPSSYQNNQQYKSTVNQYHSFWDRKFSNYTEQEKLYLQSPQPPNRPVSPSLYPSVSPSPSPYPSVSPSPSPYPSVSPIPKKQSNFEKHKKIYIIVFVILLLLLAF